MRLKLQAGAGQGVVVAISHFSPVSSAARLQEVNHLVKQLQQWLPLKGGETVEPLILLGDINTSSPVDSLHYAQPETLRQLRATPALRRKFINPHSNPVQQAKEGGEIDYRPMQALLDAGFFDLHQQKMQQQQENAEDGAQTSPLAFTVPTPLNEDAMHAAPLRLDYAMANAPLLQALRKMIASSEQDKTDLDTLSQSWVRVGRGSAAAELSDHYPLLVNLQMHDTKHVAH